ncbi:MAG: hypothetical protein LBV74_00160 [Tannerella sp.]|jgi:hypothetical protein|nr:hypothetical protein [Tannerella sp.]
MLKGFEENGDVSFSLKQGGAYSFIVFGTNYAVKYLRNTDVAKQLARAIADTKQYDIIIQKLSTIMNHWK